MSRKKRRTFNPQEKADIVLEILREEKTLAEISDREDIAQAVLGRWKKEFLENMTSVFDKKGDNIEKVQKEHEEEKDQLIKKIGELTMDVDWLKKKHKQVSEMRKKRD